MPTITEAADLAQTILTGLGEDFALPDVSLDSIEYTLPEQAGNPLYATIDKIEMSDLTEGVVGGSGAFDKLMTTHRAHLKEEYEKGRITGDQYAKAYIELTSTAMQAGVQMVLGQNQAYWQAMLVQAQARRAEIEAVNAAVTLETAKAQLAMATFQAETAKSQDVLTKMQISTENAKYDLTLEQLTLMEEKVESERGNTLDTRRDGTGITGSVGKQKQLYDQQIDSYQKDASYKVGKLFTDGWITQKTMDEGLTAPNNFTNAEVDEVLSQLRAGVNLGTL